MIRDTIAKIEARLKDSRSLNDRTRQELLSLLDTLRGEVTELSKTDAARAQRIAGVADTSTEAAVREEPNAEHVQNALQELSASVDGFEQSHPKLVQIVNRIATTLSNLGI